MKILAGVDEVGRGSLIGPVYAAAVILNNSIDKRLLKDSKTLTKDKREELEKYIKKNSIWAIGQASTKEIEKINILHASLLAMKRAILKLKIKPSLVLIDGNKLPDLKNYKLEYVIKGDQKIPSISAASIIAAAGAPKAHVPGLAASTIQPPSPDSKSSTYGYVVIWASAHQTEKIKMRDNESKILFISK